MQQYLSVTLPNGRQLGYAEYGDPMGDPVFYFHGFPCCRLEAYQLHEMAASNHCRIISIDRPGMGLSTFQKNRTLLSWPSDVIALADALGVAKFSVLGVSAGSAYVAACAYAIAHRLKSAFMISGLATLNYREAYTHLPRDKKWMCRLIKMAPWLTNIMMRRTYRMLKNPRHKMQIGSMAEVDRCIFQHPHYQQSFKNTMLEACKNGVEGPAHDMRLICQPWGFALNDIVFPVNIWHGDQDLAVPVGHAKILARFIPNARLHIVKNEGHLSLLYNHLKKILACD